MKLHNILTVDDEISNLDVLERTFRNEYNVFSATSGSDAMVMMEQNEIALILADHRMPGMTGIEFLERTLERYPDTIRIVLTGYTDKNLLMDAINRGHVYSYINKPWDTRELLNIVREGVQAYEMTRSSREVYTRTLLDTGVISESQLDNALQVQKSRRKTIGEVLIGHNMISQTELDTAMKLQQSGDEQLEEIVVDRGFVSPEDMETALELQKHEPARLAKILIDLGYADEESISSSYALQLGMPYLSLAQLPSRPELVELLPSDLAFRHAVVPIDSVGRVLVVATSEPLSRKAMSDIEERTGYKVMCAYASPRDVEATLRGSYTN